jgi:deoxyadenosine/deoxycytidine kinase
MEQILLNYGGVDTIFNKSYQIISIEGNIGSGKTTLLNRLKEQYKDNKKVVFIREPVDDWEQIKDNQGNTMIQKFYQDQEKYSFSFQMMAYISRLALMKEVIKQYEREPGMTFITERCLQTDKYVFAKMLYESGKIEEVNYQIYCKWFDVFAEECKINKIIYVKVDPNICDLRIKGRNRLGESGIPIEYLSSCHEYHEEMMKIMVDTSQIMVVDGQQKIMNWLNNINSFIEV